MIFLFIPNIYFSSKLIAVKGNDGKEEIRPSQTEVGSIFNIRPSDPHDRDVNVFERDKSLLTDPFFMFFSMGKMYKCISKKCFTILAC